MNANKKIVVNTIILYGKLFVTTIIGLISSRYILNALGASDFGIYSIVGGLVALLNVLGTTMVSTSYRFLAVELGKGAIGNLQKIYSTIFILHLFFALLLLIVGETVGLYYVNNILVVAPNRLTDIRFVLHISLLTSAISLINVPAQGLTIAREKFLYTSVVEIISSVVKIILVIWLTTYVGDRLRAYSIIILFLSIITTVLYQLYCYRNDKKTISFKLNTNRLDYVEILRFSGWSLLGATACIGNNQGSAMIINQFFSTTVNASYGIASQVNNYAMVFVKSITQAAVPQIMKSYGEGNTVRGISLVYTICRFSALALLIILVPLMTFTNEVLIFWLGTPPEYSAIFILLLLVNTFFSTISSGFDPCIQSTGDIKYNEIVYSIIYLMQLPLLYYFYKIGTPVYVNVIILTICTILIKLFQMFLLTRITSFRVSVYCKETLLPVVLTAIVSLLPSILKCFLNLSLWGTIILFAFSIVWTIAIIYFIGLNKTEKDLIINYLKIKFKF